MEDDTFDFEKKASGMDVTIESEEKENAQRARHFKVAIGGDWRWRL